MAARKPARKARAAPAEEPEAPPAAGEPWADWDPATRSAAKALVDLELATPALRRALRAHDAARAELIARKLNEQRLAREADAARVDPESLLDGAGDLWAAREAMAIDEAPPATRAELADRLGLVPGWLDRARPLADRLAALRGTAGGWLYALARGEAAARAAARGAYDEVTAGAP